MLLRYDTSARALTHVDLYKLPRVSFDAIIVQYPRPSRHLVTTAHQVMPADFAGEFDHKVTQLLEDPDMLEEVESEPATKPQPKPALSAPPNVKARAHTI